MLTGHLRWLYNRLTLLDNGEIVVQAIINGTALAISDGSFHKDYGTVAWVLEGDSSLGRLGGTAIAPGGAYDQSAYRSELTGVYAIIMTVKLLVEQHGITSGSIQVACDGLSALNMVFSDATVSLDEPCFDIILASHLLLQASPLAWNHIHVEGHQDDDPFKPLDQCVLLNIVMDKTAKAFLPIAQPLPRTYQVPGEPWSIWYKQSKVQHQFDSTLRAIIHGQQALAYWASKQQMSAICIMNVYWEATGRTMKEVPQHTATFISKHSAGMCGVGKLMKRWKL